MIQISIAGGYSIGDYDADKIEGSVAFGIVNENEPYKGIGRGDLNIANLPVFSEGKGAFSSPGSDSVRTAVSAETKNFLMIIIEFGQPEKLDEATNMAVELPEIYADAQNIKTQMIR